MGGGGGTYPLYLDAPVLKRPRLAEVGIDTVSAHCPRNTWTWLERWDGRIKNPVDAC